ncbi:hypothetical protein [Microtetraspora malaysiensis]|uniref:hypothetical protein n=1 Tax=Microtetraspora malaysiensis TaxID=161358 RepID=UPI003D8AE12E
MRDFAGERTEDADVAATAVRGSAPSTPAAGTPLTRSGKIRQISHLAGPARSGDR